MLIAMPDAMVAAIRSGDLRAVREAAAVDPRAARHPHAIVEAGRRAFQPALAYFHKHGADLNASWKNYRALHSLLQEEPHGVSSPDAGRLACLDWLLVHGADPELAGAWPSARAVLVAAFVGRPVFVDRLLAAGARWDGFTAAALGDLELLRRVLGDDPAFATARDGEGGLTALQCTAGSRMPGAPLVEAARLLLDAGAEIAARTRSWAHEIDAAYLAANSGNAELFGLLLERGADPTGAFGPPVWNQAFALAEIALEHGAAPDRATSGGKPLLNDLIRWGQIPQTLWLLGRGASPNIPDDGGWTAVHQAASRGNLRLLEAVLEAGGDRSRRDLEGRLPLDIAVAAGRDKLAARLVV